MAVAVGAALDRVAEGDDLRVRLNRLRAHAGDVLAGRFGVTASVSQIIPLILGDERRPMAAAAPLRKAGFDVPGIRPPPVPEGTSRMRIPLHPTAGAADVEAPPG